MFCFSGDRSENGGGGGGAGGKGALETDSSSLCVNYISIKKKTVCVISFMRLRNRRTGL